jgi:hypothetical protein
MPLDEVRIHCAGSTQRGVVQEKGLQMKSHQQELGRVRQEHRLHLPTSHGWPKKGGRVHPPLPGRPIGKMRALARS